MSTYRGYYAGMRNMAPTGFSQLIECIGKLIFGTVLAKLVMVYANNQFAAGAKVFGTVCTTMSHLQKDIATKQQVTDKHIYQTFTQIITIQDLHRLQKPT